jgi:hypothetical protein
VIFYESHPRVGALILITTRCYSQPVKLKLHE